MPIPITQTGIKGFLIWFAREQPALFNQIAPKLPSMVPAAFSNYTAQQKKLKAIYATGQSSGMRGFGDTGPAYEIAPVYSVAASTADPITVNYDTSLASAPLDTSVSVNYDSTLTPINTGDIDTTNTPTVNIPPVAAAANSGSAAQPIANAIAQTIGAAASIAMTNSAAAQQQALVQAQLARATAGLTPANTTVSSLGIPTVTASSTSTTTTSLLVLGAAVVAVLVLTGSDGSKKHG